MLKFILIKKADLSSRPKMYNSKNYFTVFMCAINSRTLLE